MANYNIERFFKSFPTMAHRRNRFPWEKEINFNMKMGQITPLMAIRIVPGCTYNLDLSTVLKVAPLQQPPQDTAIFKAFAFASYDRNQWENYPYWFGEKKNPENPEEEPTYLVPKVTAPGTWTETITNENGEEETITHTGFKFNSFYDNIGCVPGVSNYKIDAFLPRSDRDIYNTYFRNQTLENPLEINRGDEDDDPMQNMELRYICKPRDYFTQGLPTQSGTTPVEIPLGATAPVAFSSSPTLTDSTNKIIWGRPNDVNHNPFASHNNSYNAVLNNYAGITTGPSANSAGEPMIPVNMYADLSKAMGAPLEGLYQAIAYNTFQYITSRSGNRYFERLANIYGCVNPDNVLRQPEFLGSLSQMIEFDTVTQTSSTNSQETPLGHRAANGYMENYGGIINKSFGEFGWILVYGVVTHYPKYQQGVSKLMQTDDPLELFNPIFNLMGDEPIYNSEIYIQSDNVVNEEGTPVNDEVWAYGKRNARLLYPVNEIHGELRSSYPQSLDTNHFGEYFDELPNLNKEFDKINDKSFKRALQVTDETQFVGNCVMTGTLDIEIPTEAIPQAIPDISFTSK